MQIFGLIGLLIAIVLGVTLVIRTPALAPAEVEPDTDNTPGLTILEEATEAAKQIERGSVGRSVEIYTGITVAENAGLKRLDVKLGDKFDVNTMSAVEEVATDELDKDQCLSAIIQSGYELNGKLLREVKEKIFIKK
jgi:hypothetical protein